MNRHSSEKEMLQGQIPITPDDLKRIPEVVATPDSIEPVGRTAVGREALVYMKRVNGDIYYVKEIRTGRRELSLTTMWKRPATPGATPEGGVPHTAKTDREPGNIVPPPPKDATDVFTIGQADRWREAHQLRRAQGFLFERGASKDVGARSGHGYSRADIEVASQYLNSGRKAAEDADQFIAALGRFPDLFRDLASVDRLQG